MESTTPDGTTTLTSDLHDRPSPGLVAVSLSVYLVIAAILVRSSVAIPSIRWMYIYEPSDFPTVSSLWSFLDNLRVPIPPVTAAAEILSYQWTGSMDLVVVFGYRLAIILGFALAILLASTSRTRLVVSLVASIVFLWGTVKVHPFNPQVYDVFFPLFLLLWLSSLGLAASSTGRRALPVLLAGLSGAFLSLAELTRPFFVFVLPVALVGSVIILGTRRRSLAVSLAVPVLLLSGGWHAHLLISHGQLLASNHGGFNLAHAWPQVGINPMLLVAEPQDAPIMPGRWENLNTDAHTENSARLTRAVLRYVMAHPIDALQHSLVRVSIYLAGPVPETIPSQLRAGMSVYRLTVVAMMAYLLVETAALAAVGVWGGAGAFRRVASLEGLLAVVTLSILVLQAVGSAVEEARLVLSLLPLLAALPSYGVAGFLRDEPRAALRVAASLLLMGLLVLAAVLMLDPLRGRPFSMSERQWVAVVLAGGLTAGAAALRPRVPRPRHVD